MGNITVFGLDPGFARNVTSGPDSALWATADHGLIRIDPINPIGLAKTYALNPGSGVDRITTGPDGNVWFTEVTLNKIGYISPDGKLTDFQVTDCGITDTNHITAGSDGAVWFTCPYDNSGQLGRITRNGTISEFSEFQIFFGG